MQSLPSTCSSDRTWHSTLQDTRLLGILGQWSFFTPTAAQFQAEGVIRCCHKCNSAQGDAFTNWSGQGVGGGFQTEADRLARGKKCIAVNMKKPEGQEIVRKLCSQADVLIEPFRTGVMERLNLGPEHLMKLNPRLVYARLTGYGQSGSLAARAGHDINYLAISGVLSMLGRKGENPYAPINLLADFAGGGLTCAFGIAMALLERDRSGKGQVIDANMVEGAAYIGSFLWRSEQMGIWGNPRGENMLDSGVHFYDTYKTSDGKYMAVGCIEPQFYDLFIKGLGLTHDDAPQYGDPTEMKEKVRQIFSTKTQAEWCDIFDDIDACVTPILSKAEAAEYPHAKSNGSFMTNSDGGTEPIPAPRLSRTPGVSTVYPQPKHGEHSSEILQSLGYTKQDINRMFQDSLVEGGEKSKL